MSYYVPNYAISSNIEKPWDAHSIISYNLLSLALIDYWIDQTQTTKKKNQKYLARSLLWNFVRK